MYVCGESLEEMTSDDRRSPEICRLALENPGEGEVSDDDDLRLRVRVHALP